jgi:hypothetical protein
VGFKYDYKILDNAQRQILAAGLPEAAPTRGTILGAAPAQAPDYLSKDQQKLRLFFFCLKAGDLEDTTGTVTFSVWARDVVEWGDASNLNPNPPDPTKVAWVRLADGVVLKHLQEYVIENAQKRAIYIQATAFGGATVKADIFVAPFDTWRPMESR